MREIFPDMRRAALIRQDEAAHSRALPDRSKFGRSDTMMTHADSGHIAISVADLRTLSDEVALLYARVGALMDASGVDPAPATVLPANVVRLADYRPRSFRQAVSR